jgi:hypothetical protein
MTVSEKDDLADDDLAVEDDLADLVMADFR